jgi:hypothetical protein
MTRPMLGHDSNPAHGDVEAKGVATQSAEVFALPSRGGLLPPWSIGDTAQTLHMGRQNEGAELSKAHSSPSQTTAHYLLGYL